MEIRVTCAIIENEGKVLCAQRSERMSLPLKWEFPGGKLENGESIEVGLIREIQEELGVQLKVLEVLPDNLHSYSAVKVVRLIPMRCEILSGNAKITEHKQIKWLSREELLSLDWAEADIPIVNRYVSAQE